MKVGASEKLVILSRVDSADVFLVRRIEDEVLRGVAVLGVGYRLMKLFATGSIRFAGMIFPGNTWLVRVAGLEVAGS